MGRACAARSRGDAQRCGAAYPASVLTKAFRKGHRYHSIVCDLERATVEFVAEEVQRELGGLLSGADGRTAHRAEGGGDGHVGAVHHGHAGGTPKGAEKIVFDRFHIMREMTRAVDTVRKQEHRGLPARRRGLAADRHQISVALQ